MACPGGCSSFWDVRRISRDGIMVITFIVDGRSFSAFVTTMLDVMFYFDVGKDIIADCCCS